jgi:hypothetical protein
LKFPYTSILVQNTLATAVIRAAPETAVFIHTAPARVGTLLLPTPTTVVGRTQTRALGRVRVAALVGKVTDLTGATRVCFAVASLLLDASRAAAAIGVDWRAAVNACLGLLNVAFVEGAGHTFAVLRGSGLNCKIWVGQHTALPDDGHLEMSHLQESARGKSSAAETAARKRERMVTAFMMMMWVDSERLLSRMKMI